MLFSMAPSNFLSAISFFGGIAAQEVIKLTGKYTPLPNLYIHEFYSGLYKNQDYENIR